VCPKSNTKKVRRTAYKRLRTTILGCRETLIRGRMILELKEEIMVNEKFLEKNFQKPSKDFGPVPFWFLNNDLAEEEIDWFLQELVDKGNSGVFLHPRTGLEVEYLSRGFWEKIAYCIEACRKYGLKAWLYDEYNWPSGVAGGRILREHPEYAQSYLDYRVSF
jgi:hypothetical protein